MVTNDKMERKKLTKVFMKGRKYVDRNKLQKSLMFSFSPRKQNLSSCSIFKKYQPINFQNQQILEEIMPVMLVHQ